MKWPVLLLLWPLTAALGAETNSWTLAAPDARCAITVFLDGEGRPGYRAACQGQPVILDSPLGVRRDDQAFERDLRLVQAGEVESRRETYELFTGPQPRVDHLLNHRTLVFSNPGQARLELDLAASHEGVAFRYRFSAADTNVHVLACESTGFRVLPATRAWLQPYHAASDYTPAYEDFFFHVSPGDPPPQSRGKPLGWCFPALFHVAEAGVWALVTESGTGESYCGCHLGPESSGGLYRIAFPAANERTKRQPLLPNPEPRSSLPWALPWRVIMLGPDAGSLATSTLVTDLAPPSRIPDTSWIRPGRASWSWWSYPEGPVTEARFNQFTDLAAEMQWEYTLFDAGWWKLGLTGIVAHAQMRGVKTLAWCAAGDFYQPQPRERKLRELASAGVSGAKVDFWCSDRQEAIAAMQALLAEAAARRLVVNLHGCTLPRGWQRTWPNFLAAEAVLGTESYFYESRYPGKAAELNTVLPFTRNVAGPMDYTPIACSLKKYRRTTTAAHELATSIVFTSGLIHFADKPEYFSTLPAEARQVLREAPARWDETRCLIGEPGQLAVFARRSGGVWFIAGLNGTGVVRQLSLDLSRFAGFPKRQLIAEGADSTLEVAAATIPAAAQWSHSLPPRGGFILRLAE